MNRSTPAGFKDIEKAKDKKNYSSQEEVEKHPKTKGVLDR